MFFAHVHAFVELGEILPAGLRRDIHQSTIAALADLETKLLPQSRITGAAAQVADDFFQLDE
jgi:hypothetical protein